MDFNLDTDTLKSLIKLMTENGLNELELEEDGKRIHLRRGDDGRHHAVALPVAAGSCRPVRSRSAPCAMAYRSSSRSPCAMAARATRWPRTGSTSSSWWPMA